MNAELNCCSVNAISNVPSPKSYEWKIIVSFFSKSIDVKLNKVTGSVLDLATSKLNCKTLNIGLNVATKWLGICKNDSKVNLNNSNVTYK